MCSIEKDLEKAGKMPSFYHRFVDDTITTQRDLTSADAFLSTLNSCHPSISFTMEVLVDGKLPFLGMEAVRNGRHLETKVYVKPTNKGLLLHYDSHVDERYKRSLIKTMLHRAFRLSSSWKYFTEECERLKQLGSFSKGHEYEYEYEFYHIPANTRHTAYAISYSQQKVVAVAQFSTTFVVNLVVNTTSYGKSNFLCFLACKN